MATFPDQLTDYLQPSVDKYTFTIAELLSVAEDHIDITGGTAAFEVPCVINLEDELIYAPTKTSTTLTGCTRGYGGTTDAEHADGTAGYIPLIAEHYEEMVNGKDAVIKYLCRTVMSLPSSDEEEYEMVEYADEIYIYNGATWERIGITTSHDDWKDLDSGDPHPVYYLVAELGTAHDALAGAHVIDGDAHDHLEGTGFGAIDTTISRISSAPTYDGEIVINTTTGVLYVAYIIETPDPTDWIEVTGAPSGLIMPFDPTNLSGSCPTGWSRYTDLDEKFVKGTSGSSSSTGGSATHSHTYDATDVVTHAHSVSAQTMDATVSKNHTHSLKIGSGSSNDGIWKGYTGAGGGMATGSGGAHSHTGTMINNTENTGAASPTTDSVNGEPLYQKVVWCQKD